ncbi:MAG: hypothetical protein JO323_15915 [Acidobacteriia bacterium]|nr:hypothetical protein [Terriglobia bacterium]
MDDNQDKSGPLEHAAIGAGLGAAGVAQTAMIAGVAAVAAAPVLIVLGALGGLAWWGAKKLGE